MTMPRPLDRKAKIGSSGIGKQQRAEVTSSPSAPAMASGSRRRRAVVRRGRRQQAARHERRQPLAQPDLLVELVEILHAQLAERGLHATLRVTSFSDKVEFLRAPG